MFTERLTRRLGRRGFGVFMMALALAVVGGSAKADSTIQSLPFSQDWLNTALITTDDDWSGVPGIIGYSPTTVVLSGTDPQNITDDRSSPVDIIANQTSNISQGGIAEFDGLANPVVALQPSNASGSPHLVISLNTTGKANINVAYNLRDIDGSLDNAIQPVALQYRVGSTGDYINVPAGFIADATTGGFATQVTPVNVTLPSNANGKPLVQVRIITANAVSNDEWVGVDDINITGVSNSPPTATNDFYTTNEDQPLNVADGLTDLLSNDTDPDNDSLTALQELGPSNGTLMLNPNGAFTYTPNANFNGTDSFTYKANDGTTNSLTGATVTITVNPVDEPQPPPPHKKKKKHKKKHHR